MAVIVQGMRKKLIWEVFVQKSVKKGVAGTAHYQNEEGEISVVVFYIVHGSSFFGGSSTESPCWGFPCWHLLSPHEYAEEKPGS